MQPTPISKEEYDTIRQFTDVVMSTDAGSDKSENTKKAVYNVLYKVYRKLEAACVSKEEKAKLRDTYNKAMLETIKNTKNITRDNNDKELLEKTKKQIDVIKSIIAHIFNL